MGRLTPHIEGSSSTPSRDGALRNPPVKGVPRAYPDKGVTWRSLQLLRRGPVRHISWRLRRQRESRTMASPASSTDPNYERDICGDASARECLQSFDCNLLCRCSRVTYASRNLISSEIFYCGCDASLSGTGDVTEQLNTMKYFLKKHRRAATAHIFKYSSQQCLLSATLSLQCSWWERTMSSLNKQIK